MSSYRPEQDPRFLPEQEEEEAENYAAIETESELRLDLAVLGLTQTVFQADGWNHVASTLESKVEEATERLISGTSKNDDQERGRIAAYKWMLDLPKGVASEYRIKSEQLRNFTQQPGDGDLQREEQ